MRRREASYLLPLVLLAPTIISICLCSRQVQDSRNEKPEGSFKGTGAITKEHQSDYGEPNVKPTYWRELDKQAEITDFSDVRTQVSPELIDPHPHGIHQILDQINSKLLGDPSDEELGARTEFAQYALTDKSNDHLVRATTQEIIVQAGYDYETHYVESTDGYITQIVRLINPLADQSRLKQPPVAMFHGVLADTSTWIASSSVQHHPEKWPRDIDVDGPITSWNRSLGFVLANNGYDVWLVGTRGCNRANQGHRTIRKRWSLFDEGVNLMDFWQNIKYWSNFTLDDIGEKEVPRQLDRIMHLTGSPKVSVMAYSASTLTTLAALSSHPNYAERIHNYVLMDPILSERNANNLDKTTYRTLCMMEEFEGTILVSELLLSPPVRESGLALAESRTLRYTLLRSFINRISKPSPKFNSLIEINILGHTLFMPNSFKQLKHFCQIFTSGKVRKYDYGPIENQIRYGSFKPPEYDLSKVRLVDNWLVVSSVNDPYSTQEDIARLIQKVGKQPYKHVFVPDNNHLDMIIAIDSDIKVNLPILDFMEQFPYATPEQDDVHPLHRSTVRHNINSLDYDRRLDTIVSPDQTMMDHPAAISDIHRRNSLQLPMVFGSNGTEMSEPLA